MAELIELESVRAMFRQKRPPTGLLADLVEFDTYFTVRVYRDNFDKLTKGHQFEAMNWINETIHNVRVVIDCYLEVWKRPGVPE